MNNRYDRKKERVEAEEKATKRFKKGFFIHGCICLGIVVYLIGHAMEKW